MVRRKLKMNTDLKDAFAVLKPVCDVLMVCPSVDSLLAYSAKVNEMKKETVQELQQYLLYPLITRIKCNEIRCKTELHIHLLDALRTVLEKISVTSFEMYMKLEMGLLSIIFDANKPGMISDASEDVKYGAVRCLTALTLNIPHEFRVKLLKNQVPILAQAVFVNVHIAKLERLRVLRLAAIHCVEAHTMTHPQLTVEYRMPDPELELLAVDNMLSSILPGVLAALQDVCCCTNNPTHYVIAAAIEAIHRILCIPMHDKYLARKPITTEDFVNTLKEKRANCETEPLRFVHRNALTSSIVPAAVRSPKDMEKRSEEWFSMAGEKLTLITKSLVALRVHEHFKVRKELAIFCYRILTECSTTMPMSIPLCLDVLISLTKDEYPEVSNYCTTAVTSYFTNAPDYARNKTMDSLCENFISLSTSLPRVLNGIDEGQKLTVLNLLHGYVEALCAGRPQRLTGALSVAANMRHLCAGLLAAAAHDTRLARRTLRVRNVSMETPMSVVGSSPWSELAHVSGACAARLQRTCERLGAAECAELVLDALLDTFKRTREPEPLYVLNWMIASPESTSSMARRIISAYIEHDVWYLPLDVRVGDTPLADGETFDITVYNPRAWTRDSVPDLYEGTVETRYSDISYRSPRTPAAPDSNYCSSLSQAQRHLVVACLLTEGVGLVARRLKRGYGSYLLQTLCPLMERIGSEYELLHLAGVQALRRVAAAGGHAAIGDIIRQNADYITFQVNTKLKKAWNCESALKILTVVMQYSDSTIANCLYGIVEDVLVQSCDKYYEGYLQSYLQAFLSFVECVRKWFRCKEAAPKLTRIEEDVDLLSEVRDYVRDTQEAERLLSDSDFERSTGRTVEELYREDMRRREEEMMDAGQATNQRTPPPQHVTVTITVLKRCINFVTSPRRESALLAMQILSQGLPILDGYDDELLPLVHQAWAPLVEKFQSKDPVVLRGAFDLLSTLAALSRDFIFRRTVKEILPKLFEYLEASSKDSYLKDAGSTYRLSPAYNLQRAALSAMAALTAHLGLRDESLAQALACLQVYLSNRQPKPLQEITVEFFRTMLDYDYGAVWYQLRKFCDNGIVLHPPQIKHMKLEPVVGTPYQHKDKEYDDNIRLIFDYMGS